MSPRVPLRHQLIGTPLQEPLMRARQVLDVHRFRHPELNLLRGEDARRREILRRVLRDDSNCVDIGAHYGSMLSRMVRFAPRGRHMAIEAMPGKAAFLRRRFRDVDVLEVAVNDTGGEVTFYLNAAETGYSGMRPHWEGSFETLTVQSRRLDDVLPAGRRIDLVKLDVEGAELMALAGAQQCLRRFRPQLFIHCAPFGPPAFGYEPKDIFDELTRLDYGMHTLHGWLAGEPPVDEVTFLRALEYPFQAFTWFAVPA